MERKFYFDPVAVAVIAIGFMLMSGGGSQDPTGFNPEIFSSRRIVVAPPPLPSRRCRKNAMQYLGIEFSLKNQPKAGRKLHSVRRLGARIPQGAEKPFKIAVEREGRPCFGVRNEAARPRNCRGQLPLCRALCEDAPLSVGGWKVTLCGDDALAKRMVTNTARAASANLTLLHAGRL